MSESLCYCIAGQFLHIETKHPKETKRLLPTFRPFLVEHSQAERVLFRFCGGGSIRLPNAEPDETHTAEQAFFKVYYRNGAVLVSMLVGNKEHRMELSADGTSVISDLTLTAPEEEYFLTFLLRTAFGMTAVYRGVLKMHASVVIKAGRALAFLGKSGTGKSTHSRLWLKYVPGSRLLNDDEPLVRLMPDGSVRIYGAPWSGSTPCYKSEDAPLAGFVQLSQAPENKLSVLRPVRAFTRLFQSASVFRSHEQHREQLTGLIYDILERVPVYYLENRPDRQAVELSLSVLEGAAEEAPEALTVKHIDNRLFFDEAMKQLEQGNKVRMRARGSSMVPFIRDGRDVLVLERPGAASFRRGRLLAALLPGEDRYVIHRVARLRGERLWLRGDAVLTRKETCLHSDVVAEVTEVVRGDTSAKVGSLRWNLYRFLWPRNGFLRRAALAVYRRSTILQKYL